MSIFLSFCKASRMRRAKMNDSNKNGAKPQTKKREFLPSLFVCSTADNTPHTCRTECKRRIESIIKSLIITLIEKSNNFISEKIFLLAFNIVFRLCPDIGNHFSSQFHNSFSTSSRSGTTGLIPAALSSASLLNP